MNAVQRLPLPGEPYRTNAVEISLNAAVLSIDHDAPCFLTVPRQNDVKNGIALPSGPFVPSDHMTLDNGLRSWVLEQTGVELGYLEQLYTFGDQPLPNLPGHNDKHIISLGYMALTRAKSDDAAEGRHWLAAYDFLPWEDWRDGKPEILAQQIEPHLRDGLTSGSYQTNAGEHRGERLERLRIAFGLDGAAWDEERVLERYELLQDAGLLADPNGGSPVTPARKGALSLTAAAMSFAHRRILASALGRLRAKIKYRPVLFELMAGEFTLFELQRTVEAILGSRLHKQNFRRLVESGGLVDPTTDIRTHTGGRPAKLFRFRREVLLERPAPGVRVRAGLAA